MGFRVKANKHNLHALGVFMHFANGDFRGTIGWEPIDSGADCRKSYTADAQASSNF
jgi:hypothetical protein